MFPTTRKTQQGPRSTLESMWWPLPCYSLHTPLPPFPPGCGDAGSGAPNASSVGKDTVPGRGSSQHLGQDNESGGSRFGAGGSFALQALYATDAVKQAFASLSHPEQPALILDLDDDSDDDEEDWEDKMDPVAFARYYAAQNLHLAKIVQDHDAKVRERLNEGIAGWVKSVQSEILS
jgi:hypothetical protein